MMIGGLPAKLFVGRVVRLIVPGETDHHVKLISARRFYATVVDGGSERICTIDELTPNWAANRDLEKQAHQLRRARAAEQALENARREEYLRNHNGKKNKS